LGGSFIGIDVGENFLDLAILDTRARTLVLKRVALDGLNGGACATLAGRIKEVVPGVDAHVSVLVDSPRWPRDLDWSNPSDKRDPAPREREIDVELKRIFSLLMGAPDGKPYKPGLAMFPTPRYDYFTQWADAVAGKPHLSAIAKELFGALSNGNACGPIHGGTFTRFMLAGFATYRALEGLGIDAFESYPDLQLRLSSPSALPPKKRHTQALNARRDIVASLARDLDLPELWMRLTPRRWRSRPLARHVRINCGRSAILVKGVSCSRWMKLRRAASRRVTSALGALDKTPGYRASV